MKRFFGCLAVLLLLSACGTVRPLPDGGGRAPDKGAVWYAAVASVSDGDTFRVKNPDGGKNIAIRVYGVDAPEKNGRRWSSQPYSGQSGDLARSLLPVGSRVGLVTRDTDRYRRTVALVVLPDGRTLQEKLVESGLAWVYPQYCKTQECADWKRLEENARKNRLGLWRDERPTPPWEWRKAGGRAPQ